MTLVSVFIIYYITIMDISCSEAEPDWVNLVFSAEDSEFQSRENGSTKQDWEAVL